MPLVECWRTIGFLRPAGVAPCGQLAQFGHCHHCPLFAEAARHLLNQPLPDHYRESWREQLASGSSQQQRVVERVFLFAVQKSWFALPLATMRVVGHPGPLCHLPHVQRQLLGGLVNIRGEICLSVSLEYLFDLEHIETEPGNWLLLFGQPGHDFACVVHELSGVASYSADELQPPPPGHHAALRGLLRHERGTVALLDDKILMQTLEGRLA